MCKKASMWIFGFMAETGFEVVVVVAGFEKGRVALGET